MLTEAMTELLGMLSWLVACGALCLLGWGILDQSEKNYQAAKAAADTRWEDAVVALDEERRNHVESTL
jgi:hypothetical protein